MTTDYHLTEKDVDLSLLTAEERESLQQQLDDRNNEYMNEVVTPRDIDFHKEREALLNKLAVEAGFTAYRPDGSGTTVQEAMDARLLPMGEITCPQLEKFEELKQLPEYQEFEETAKRFHQDDMEFLAESTQTYLMDALCKVLPRMDWEQKGVDDSKNQVTLTRNDLYSSYLNDDESKALKEPFEDFLKRLEDKVLTPLAGEDTATLEKARTYFNGIATQIYYRNMLAKTGERVVWGDSRGERILSPAEYLDKVAACKDNKEKAELTDSITRPVLLKTIVGEKEIQADFHLAHYLQRINAAGYITGQSCSGLLSDHPNYRYVEDDELGRYIKGECINLNKQGSSAYITFWQPEAGIQNTDTVNTPEQVEDIRRVAAQQGWIVEDTKVFFRSSLHLTLPMTYDGTGKRQIMREADERTDNQYPGLKEADFLQWLDKRRPFIVQVQEEHGGVVRWTDMMILQQWEKLTWGLEAIYKQKQVVERETQHQKDLERISDIIIYPVKYGQYRIRCKIDGEQQMSERLSEHDVKRINNGTGADTIAAEIYKDRLEEQQQKGLKR